MLRLNRFLAIGFLSASVFQFAHAQNGDVSTVPLPETYFPELKAIIQAAVAQSPRMIARNIDNTIAEQNRIAARAGQLPAVGALVQYNPWQRDRRADLAEPTDTKKFYYSISLIQPLFHWGALQSATRMGQLQVKIATGLTAEAYRLLVQEIRGSYLQLVLKKLALSRTGLYLDITTEQLNVAQTKLEKRVFSEAEMFMPRLTHDQARLSLDRATADYEDSKVMFAKLTGASPLNDNQIGIEIPQIAASPENLRAVLTRHVGQTVLDSYLLANLRTQIEIEDLTHQIATTRLKPKVNFLLGASQDEQSYTANIAQKYELQSTFVGVQVTWTIFDGFSARSAINSSNARKRQLQRSLDEASTNLSDSLRIQLRNLEFAARSMEMGDRMLGSGEAMLTQKQEDSKRGVVSDAEVRAARLNYYDAQVNAFNSRFDYLMKTTDFLSSMLEDPALENLPKHTP